MTAVILIFIICYLIVIIGLIYGFGKVPDFKLGDLPSLTKFTIIIPFRNESDNLGALLESISNLNYPRHLFEVLLIDDASIDDSKNIIDAFLTKTPDKNLSDTIKIIENKRTSNSPKKDAITTGIGMAKYAWIVTTDADCKIPKYWLESFDEYIQTHQTDCIVGPVKFEGVTSFFTRFQILDTLSLQAATLGGFGLKKPFLSNGANFAYKKSAFKDVNGFEGNNHIASGDDIFLLEKIAQHKSLKLNYIKSEQSIVTTQVVSNLKSLINQRIRWASKTSQSKSAISKFIGIIVVITNCIITALIPLVLFGVVAPKTAGLIFLIKFSIDLHLIFKASRFFNQESFLLSYPFASIFYPFFATYISIACVFKSYEWKGRSYKG